MTPIEKALLVCDASFELKNFNKHINKTNHLKEMGITPEQYYSKSEKLSLQPAGGNIISFNRKDGSKVKYNVSTTEYVAYRGDKIITYHNRRKSQVKREMEENGVNVPNSLK